MRQFGRDGGRFVEYLDALALGLACSRRWRRKLDSYQHPVKFAPRFRGLRPRSQKARSLARQAGGPSVASDLLQHCGAAAKSSSRHTWLFQDTRHFARVQGLG